jgi:hypothetical protein
MWRTIVWLPRVYAIAGSNCSSSVTCTFKSNCYRDLSVASKALFESVPCACMLAFCSCENVDVHLHDHFDIRAKIAANSTHGSTLALWRPLADEFEWTLGLHQQAHRPFVSAAIKCPRQSAAPIFQH